jgi:glucose/arabinose dehydrogenase/mono/diheme cytochrome c family protein
MKALAVSLLLFTCMVCSALQCGTSRTKAVSGLLSPQQAIADFQIEEGFAVEAVAAEPAIEDPVALQWDADGAMWVLEMRGYMHDEDGGGENMPLGRIKILKDANGDGTYESASVFLDSLIMPRAVLPVNGGALVIEPPKLLFVKNKYGKGGKVQVIDSLFIEGGNVEHQPNALMPAMDNWIYCAKSNKRVRLINNQWVVEKTQFRGQWGLTQDDMGRLFYNDNSITLLGDNFLPNAFAENEAYRRQSKTSYNVQLVSNRVFPRRTTTGVNRGYEKEVLDSTGRLVNVTAACGPVIYRGDQFPEKYRGNAFVMEPSGYLIKRIVLTQDSNGFVRGALPYENKEFLTATDERFRPVNAYNAPDGALYFIDMHRGVIQHTTYLTPYLRRYIDSLKLQRPIGMGRIYRIRWKERELLKKLPLTHLPAQELVKVLEHKNGWYRDMAQRLLIERNDSTLVASLKTLALSQNPVTALHALYTLEGMQQLTPEFLYNAAQATTTKMVYTTCMKLLENVPDKKTAFDLLKKLALRPDRLVALQFVNSLASFEKTFPAASKTLMLKVLDANRNDTLFWDAFMGSAATQETKRLAWFPAPGDSTFRNALTTIIKKRRQAAESPAAWLSKQETGLYKAGMESFKKNCATCHGTAGEGLTNIAPPLAGSEWVTAKDVSVPIRILLDGMSGPVSVAGKRYAPPEYNGAMPGLRNNIEANNGGIAAVLTYIRNSWGNKAGAVTVEEVAAVRKATAQRRQPYTEIELRETKTATQPASVRKKNEQKEPHMRQLAHKANRDATL